MDVGALRALSGVWKAQGYARAHDNEMTAVDETITLHVDDGGSVTGKSAETPCTEIDESIVVVHSHSDAPSRHRSR